MGYAYISMLEVSMKRTTVTIPQNLATTLKEATSASSKTEAVLIAIEGEIKRRKLASIRRLSGKLQWAKSAKGRHHDHRLN